MECVLSATPLCGKTRSTSEGFARKYSSGTGYRCRVCDASGRDKRSIIVHHRVSGKSFIPLMISLCPACHAKIHRNRVVLRMMPPLLLELWREQHLKAHEQTALNFSPVRPPANAVALFTAK